MFTASVTSMHRSHHEVTLFCADKHKVNISAGDDLLDYTIRSSHRLLRRQPSQVQATDSSLPTLYIHKSVCTLETYFLSSEKEIQLRIFKQRPR